MCKNYSKILGIGDWGLGIGDWGLGYLIDLLAHVYLQSTDYHISYNHGYTDVVNVVLGSSIMQRDVAILQHMYDRLLQGGSVTVLVTHI